MNTERTIVVVLVLIGLLCAAAEGQTARPSIIAMGASTGGTEVFKRVLEDLDDCLEAGWTIPPILVVQHGIGPSYVDYLMNGNPNNPNDPRRLYFLIAEMLPSTPVPGEMGQELMVNHVYFAPSSNPGSNHLGVVWHDNKYKIEVSDADPEGGPGGPGPPPEYGWRPSVDYLFKRVAEAVAAAGQGHYAVGYVLAGRYQDGTEGLEAMQMASPDNKRRVQDWNAIGDGVIDVYEYTGIEEAIQMPENANPYAQQTVIAGQIIMDLFPMIRLPIITSLPPGDVNFDGVFDSSDLVIVFQAGEYEDGVVNNSTWREGDWTGDREFDSSDLKFAFDYGGYQLQSGGGFFGLPVVQQEALAQTLKVLRDANVKMDPLLQVLQLTESELKQILGE